jgi:SAM-dependent methyltransferase
VIDLLPEEGPILDLGSGRGHLAIALAMQVPSREAIGVEPVASRVAQARAAATAAGVDTRVRFVEADRIPDDIGDLAAIVVTDVLYVLAPTTIVQVVRDAMSALHEGGVLLVKEVGTSPRWKRRVNLVEETLVTRWLRLTKSDAFTPDPLRIVRSTFDELGVAFDEVPLDRGYLHAHRALRAVRTTHPSVDPGPAARVAGSGTDSEGR